MPPKKKVEPERKVLLGRSKGNLRMGLVGLPNVGKSTTFNFLAKQEAPASNFPFCTKLPQEARMNVPDERFEWLCEFFKTKSACPANLTIFDIAGLVKGAHLGEGLGNNFLSNIQSVDGIFHVVRAFEDPSIIHEEGEVIPVNDLQTINDELRLKDIERCTGIVEDQKKQAARSPDKGKKAKLVFFESVLETLKNGQWVKDAEWKTADLDMLNEVQFLTAKPVIYLVNMSQADFLRQKNKFIGGIKKWVDTNNPGPVIPYSAEFETSYAALAEDPAAQKEFLESCGAAKSMVATIINEGYKILSLIHYFTAGEDEVKCWTIRQGTKIPSAAALIHTDFEKFFICAEVYKYTDLKELGSLLEVKSNGKLLQKGKEYVVEDNDVVEIKHGGSGGGGKGKK